MQSPSEAQLLLHANVPHTYGEQGVVTGAGQEPVPLQLAPAVWVPELQPAARQIVVEPG
jgi:hypothetical protein